MLFDFSPFHRGERKLETFIPEFTHPQLIDLTNAQIDEVLHLTSALTDAQITAIAHDPEAEGGIGWNVAHLVAHTTASAEEGATIASILARGVAYGFEPRLRYETSWETLTTRAQVVQRLEESRRLRLAYLNAWPDQPNLTLFRQFPPHLMERFGELNAIGCVLLGLAHEQGHFVQIREIIRQAREATR